MPTWKKIALILLAIPGGYLVAWLVGEPKQAPLAIAEVAILIMLGILYRMWKKGEFSPS